MSVQSLAKYYKISGAAIRQIVIRRGYMVSELHKEYKIKQRLANQRYCLRCCKPIDYKRRDAKYCNLGCKQIYQNYMRRELPAFMKNARLMNVYIISKEHWLE